jgi:hypothetical protein
MVCLVINEYRATSTLEINVRMFLYQILQAVYHILPAVYQIKYIHYENKYTNNK